MGFNLKLNARRFRRFLAGDRRGKWNSGMLGNRPPWATQITHGHNIVKKRDVAASRGSMLGNAAADSVVVQREQIQDLDVWYFGLSNARVGGQISKYLQSHLFAGKKLNEFEVRRKSKETMRKAYTEARLKALKSPKDEQEQKFGSASLMVLNGKKLIMANMDDYSVVFCKDGAAYDLTNKNKSATARHWSRRIMAARMVVAKSSRQEGRRQLHRSRIVVGSEKIDWETEFIILASSGIWEVMKTQEAVNLIMHIQDPKEAARCLTNEALNRMGRGNISCMVIRFDQHL